MKRSILSSCSPVRGGLSDQKEDCPPESSKVRGERTIWHYAEYMENATDSIKNQALEKLRAVLDPELGVSIVDLGLVYGVEVSTEGVATVSMTLTTIGCPLFPVIQKDIEDRLLELPEVEDVKIDLTFDPPWTPDRMTEETKIRLGFA